ncbi:MAG: hypothetical protein RIQ79_1812 [Verrucomicrobiota bacterium]
MVASGSHSSGVDLTLCADIARTAAQAARSWAGDDSWTGLGGFDGSGAFWLSPAKAGHLLFSRSPSSAGWLLPPAPDGGADDFEDDPVGRHFPCGVAPAGFHPPGSFALLQALVMALPGFAGCALRHPSNGIWKTIIPSVASDRLELATRSFVPLARILQAQGLPVGRLLLTSRSEAGLCWRTPSKIYGYLHLTTLDSLPAALPLVDDLLLRTSQAEASR